MGMIAINKMIMENLDYENTVKVNTGNLSWPRSVRESWAEGVTVKLAVKEEGKEREVAADGNVWGGCTKVGRNIAGDA